MAYAQFPDPCFFFRKTDPAPLVNPVTKPIAILPYCINFTREKVEVSTWNIDLCNEILANVIATNLHNPGTSSHNCNPFRILTNLKCDCEVSTSAKCQTLCAGLCDSFDCTLGHRVMSKGNPCGHDSDNRVEDGRAEVRRSCFISTNFRRSSRPKPTFPGSDRHGLVFSTGGVR